MKAIGIKMVELQPMTAKEANDKGYKNGLSRHCGKCNYNPCSLDIRRLCTNRFVEGYIKGYARVKKDIKERII